MRTKNNLKRFGHTAKTKDQRHNYERMVQGQQKRGGTTNDSVETEFDDTSDLKGSVVRGDKINKTQKPFRSVRTYLAENWLGVIGAIVGVIFVPLMGWVIYGVIDNSKSLAVQGEKISTIEGNVQELKGDVATVRDRSLMTQTIVESLEKYIYQVLGFRAAQSNQ